MSETKPRKESTLADEDLLHSVIVVIEKFNTREGVNVTGSSRLRDDLGLTSVHIIELAYTLEKKYSLRPLTDDDAINVETVEDVYRLVSGLVKPDSRDAV